MVRHPLRLVSQLRVWPVCATWRARMRWTVTVLGVVVGAAEDVVDFDLRWKEVRVRP